MKKPNYVKQYKIIKIHFVVSGSSLYLRTKVLTLRVMPTDAAGCTLVAHGGDPQDRANSLQTFNYLRRPTYGR
ncbi:hypothetical protein [Nostoc sp. CCY0012]|uniref:hypothetical protein n=1 Tax=Nostoc sp. CCY0012 TaxID=1056123 RepID=UPI0039C5EFA7